eukprot:scaffold9746_cov40-Phaeocystis_antarctica.AAC.1
MTEHNPAPSPSGHPLLSGPPTLNDIHKIFTIDQSPEHGGPGLPEGLCVCAAAAMSRLSPPASPEHARCMANRASRRLPTPHG